ncbi:hypothetical protein KUV56_08270 [Ferrimonas balearica]|uniref:ABC-three component system protein n=1 Tax=Ferrimonas balearica TaxID=44012 RepID=UPI001C574BCF|nr:ABC-three component system protein [Ferrimonas balearica]MBW3139508.1 hypothetical protein [Ferrimonas balearica]
MNNASAMYQDDAQHNGDNHFHGDKSSLEIAVEAIIRKMQDDEPLIDFIDDLSDYISNHPTRPVIGLENKLLQGDRGDLVDVALFLKNKFARKVAKSQMSISEQYVYIQVLSAITTAWDQKIKPMISSGSNFEEIDSKIFDEIIEPVHRALVRFDMSANMDLVRGMLYFMTGKCHVVWRG